MTDKIDVDKVIENVEKGKEVSAAEKRAYDKAIEQATLDNGYYAATWSGRPGFRLVDGGDLWYDNERDAQTAVMRSRVHANLTGGVGA